MAQFQTVTGSTQEAMPKVFLFNNIIKKSYEEPRMFRVWHLL
jgi:hypothetical protein